MSTRRWLGTAPPVAQVTEYLFGGTWEANDVINLTIGTKTLSVVAGSTVITTIIDAIVTAWNLLTAANGYQEFDEITASRSSNSLVLTAATKGYPFTCTVATTETGGGAADAQTIDGAASSTGTNSTACSGPNHWDTAANWSGGAVPVNSDDVYIENSAVSIKYGLAQTAVTLTSLNIAQSYTGQIGLPRRNTVATEYEEYRDQYLAIKATTVNIGYGSGAGSQRLKLDQSSATSTVNIFDSGSPIETGIEAILWKGTDAANVMNVQKGSVGVAIYAGETATITTLRLTYKDNVNGDAQVRCGSGVTLTTINQSGGILETNSGCTTFAQLEGRATLRSGNVTTMNLDGGMANYNGVGTLATVNVGSDGVLNLSGEIRACTITNPVNVSPGGSFLDPNKRAGSVVIDLERSGGRFRDDDGTVLHLGSHLSLTRGATS